MSGQPRMARRRQKGRHAQNAERHRENECTGLRRRADACVCVDASMNRVRS